jgi:hypothetical protein
LTINGISPQFNAAESGDIHRITSNIKLNRIVTSTNVIRESNKKVGE